MMQQMLVGLGGAASFPDGVVYAFSGNNTADDASGNGTTISYAGKGYSSTQKKWDSYTHSFNLPGTTNTNSHVSTPGFTPSNSGWSVEFWVYPTSWAGDYVFAASGPIATDGQGSIAINVQSSQFRFYRYFYNNKIEVNETTSTYLNQWNFIQIYYDTSNIKYRINGVEKASFSGNTNTPATLMFGNGGGDGSINASGQFPITGFVQDIVVYNGFNRGAQSVPTTPFGL
jgi:hypothetical protein